MKVSLIYFVTTCAFVLSTTGKKHGVVKNRDFLGKQKHVLELLYHINQLHPFESIREIANTYSIEEHKAYFIKPEAVYNFLEYYHYDAFLPRGVVFSVMNNEHLNQAIVLFKVIYYAKNWETFYKTSVWARQHMNEGMFLYAFSVAVVHREDLQEIILPPIYEISPHYFFSQEVLQEAKILKEAFDKQRKDLQNASYSKEYTIHHDYDSGWFLNLNPEKSLSYYLEDIDVNAQYYYLHIFMPFWMNSEEFKLETHQRGQIYLYHSRQVLARYYLERISNNFGQVEEIHFESPVEVPYTPSLIYPNGLSFPTRPEFANLSFYNNYGDKWWDTTYTYSLSYVKDYCRRIDDIADKGYALAHNLSYVKLEEESGLEVLNNIIQCNNNSINSMYYGPVETYVRHLLGYSYLPADKTKLAPSVLEHYETSLRDPIMYQWLRKVVNWSERYLMHVPPYTKDQLIVPTIKITGVKFDRLITYFNYAYSDLINAVWHNNEEKPGEFKIDVCQKRMNHKPFSYKVYVNSEKEQKVVVRMYIGPKYDENGHEINLTESRLNFVSLEHFVYELKAGKNVIIRDSRDFAYYKANRHSYWEIWELVNAALNGTAEFDHFPQQNDIYWTNRVMLPMGTDDGKPYQFFFIIYPYHGEENHRDYRDPLNKLIFDEKPLGYPWNRPIKFEKMWEELPNVHFHVDNIYLE